MAKSVDNYIVLCQIGKGACGDVDLVRDKETKKLYALKRIELDESRKTRTREAVQRESQIMSELDHPNIVKCQESFFDEKQKTLCIIQDYCDGGTLEDRLKDVKAKKLYLPEKKVISWFLQIAMAVRYMHSEKVLHRDLKTPNIFLNKSGTICKLGDFGIAKAMDNAIEVASTCVGTPCYLSPEMCQDIPYTSKADIWALGCLLYEMVALKPAFDANNLVSLFYKIVKAEYEPIPDCYSDNMKDLVRIVLTKDPAERPSASGVLKVPFLRAELLKFIEEKEFILKQRRVPTRQGSRPYSTPGMVSRSTNDLPSTEGTFEMLPSQVKRAITCRPSITSTSKENTALPNTAVLSDSNPPKPRGCGRVSTILEEAEEPLPDRALRLSQSQGTENLRLQLELLREDSGDEDDEESESDSDTESATEQDEHLPPRKSKSLGNLHAQNIDLTSSTESSKPHVVKKHKNRKAKTERKSKTPEPMKRVGRDNKVRSLTPQGMGKKQRKINVSSLIKESNKENGEGTVPAPAKKTKHSVDSKKAETDKPKTDKSKKAKELPKLPARNEEIRASTNSSESAPKLPEIVDNSKPEQKPASTAPEIKPVLTKAEQAKIDLIRAEIEKSEHMKNKIKEPLRTPRNIIEPNPLQIQVDSPITPLMTPHTRATPRLGKKEASNASSRQRKSRVGKSKDGKNKDGLKIAREDSVATTIATTLDYYSDDFDDDLSSGSEIEEEIEVVPARTARSGSLAPNVGPQTEAPLPEISEIPEDLVDGKVASDEDELVEEETEQVVNVAREAHETLTDAREEPTIVDISGRINSANILIRRHCLNVLGKDKFEDIKQYCENNSIENGKLEKIAAREDMKTIYLMHEVLKKK